MTKPGHVDTPYGPLPGCPTCDAINLSANPHICEHGVTPSIEAQGETTMTLDAGQYAQWLAVVYEDEPHA